MLIQKSLIFYNNK